MSRVLLTGASGLIGSRAIASLLAGGHEVHALARDSAASAVAGADRGTVSWHRADLMDRERMRAVVSEVSPEALLHFAWYAEHGSFWTAPENLAWVGATLDLLREFVESGGRRAVLAGSCAEYEWGTADLCSEASTPLRPVTLYGMAKHATQRVASAYADSVGLAFAWGRIFLCYGPGEDERRLVPYVIRSLLAGEEARVSDGRQWRDLMHVDDLADAFVALLDSPVEGAVNVASGEALQLARPVETIAAEIGRPELLRLGALPRREGDPQKLLADVTRLREEVGFRPRVELEQGIRETIAWWRER
ncbi:MAG: NAD-dependent epimerase/dehydratase family protein [Solirubrobacterales bacterium]